MNHEVIVESAVNNLAPRHIEEVIKKAITPERVDIEELIKYL